LLVLTSWLLGIDALHVPTKETHAVLGLLLYRYWRLGIGKLIEAKEYYISSHGEHVTPFLMLEAEEQFQHKLTHHRKMFGEIGLTPPGPREQNYILEGL
jgi:hypothetical protein